MKIFHWITILLITSACQTGTMNQQNTDVAEELSLQELQQPENALLGLEIGADLTAQIFATEPMVRNPTNIDVDYQGRVWVVENVNYRPSNNPDNIYQQGGDMVVILEDVDGDGQADERKVFFQDTLVDGAMGIAVLDNRVYLSSSPSILILTDDDRDDKADRVDTLFTGMGDPQGDHTVHAVSFGPDGRLYFNYGNASPRMLHKDGSPVIDKMGNVVDNSGKPYRHGMVFRCLPDGSQLESLGHNFRNNYEVCVDSYGRMWQSDNDDDGNNAVRINYVMEYGNFGYRDELTGSAWQTKRSGWHEKIPSRHWHQNDPGVVPNLLITGSGSPCGITTYEGDLLPERFHEQLLHADAGPGTARAYLLGDAGAGFSAQMEPMLIRKYDPWYRPTDISVAPDGSVFVSDWYDPGVGGHWAGDSEKGRIFRMSTSNASQYKIKIPDFSAPKSAVDALKSPNAATRYLAWSALDDFGASAEEELVKLWNTDDPVYRARALWLLARLNQQHLDNSLKDQNPMIRATGIRVARQLKPEQMSIMLRPLLNDPSPKVRREIAIALREMQGPDVAEFWSTLAMQYDGEDRWYLEALGIGAMANWESCFQVWLNKAGDSWNNKSGRGIVWRARSGGSFAKLLELLSDPLISASEQARYLRSTDFHRSPDKDRSLTELISVERSNLAVFQEMLLTHIDPAYAQQSPEIRKALETLLPRLRGTQSYLDLVTKLNLHDEVPYVFEMVISNPGHETGVKAAQIVIELDGWERFEKAIAGSSQDAVIEALSHVNRGPGKQMLQSLALNQEEDLLQRKKAVEALSLDWGWEERLHDLLKEQNLHEELVALAATKLLGAPRPVDRAVGLSYLDHRSGITLGASLPSISHLMQMEGLVEEGKSAFTTYCSTCHQVGNLGTEFGPNLSEIGNKLGKDALFSSIIYPSAQINHGYEGYHFELTDGTHHVGYIVNEDSNQVALKVQNGSVQEIQTKNIVLRENMENSLMTEGLAQTLGEQVLVDVVAYLMTLVNKETYVSNPFQGKINYDRDEQ